PPYAAWDSSSFWKVASPKILTIPASGLYLITADWAFAGSFPTVNLYSIQCVSTPGAFVVTGYAPGDSGGPARIAMNFNLNKGNSLKFIASYTNSGGGTSAGFTGYVQVTQVGNFQS